MVVVLLVVTGPHLCMGRLKISKVNLKLKKNSCVARSDEDEPGSRYVIYIYINVQLYVSYFKIHLLTNYYRRNLFTYHNKCCFSDGQESKSSQCQKV